MSILKLVGAKVRDSRNQKGWTQEELAERAGLYYTYIGSVERGEKNISLLSLQKIAHALHVEISDFFSYSYHLSAVSEKEKSIHELLEQMLKLKSNDLKKLKAIMKEFF